MELDAIAGVVVGGTSLAGWFSCWYTGRGIHHALVLKIITIHRLQPHYQLFIVGSCNRCRLLT